MLNQGLADIFNKFPQDIGPGHKLAYAWDDGKLLPNSCDLIMNTSTIC
jgi:hypothetical protein